MGAGTQDQVKLIVFHRGIEDFFDHGAKPVNLVNKEHIPLSQMRENTRQIFALHRRATRDMHLYTQLIGYQMGDSRLAQPRRPRQEQMVKRVPTTLGSLHKDLEIVDQGLLTHQLVKALRAQTQLLVRLAG